MFCLSLRRMNFFGGLIFADLSGRRSGRLANGIENLLFGFFLSSAFHFRLILAKAFLIGE